ncbi:MAG: PKD domain-containing protein [Sporocytophaga sp.]|nr:PKD domain-containing protein [Sporocytophaga sp.]
MKKLVFIVLFSMLGLAIISCKKDDKAPAPIADFDFDTLSTEPGEIKLINKSTNAVRYNWSVSQNGKGFTYSNDPNPTFRIKNNGSYEFTLSVDNKNSVTTSKTVSISINNSSFVRVYGPNDPDLVWYCNKISNSKDTEDLYINCENGLSSISITLPTGYIEGKTYDVLTDKGFAISYHNYFPDQNYVDSYLTKNIGKLKIIKATDSYIEGTFDFVAENNSTALSFTNGEFRVIF